MNEKERVVPVWTTNVISIGPTMDKNSEDYTAWKLKYNSIEEWWQSVIKDVEVTPIEELEKEIEKAIKECGTPF